MSAASQQDEPLITTPSHALCAAEVHGIMSIDDALLMVRVRRAEVAEWLCNYP